MSRLRIDLLVFLAGLAVVGWIGAGYLGGNPLALAVTVLIAAFYLGGALELHRYRQATASLARALGSAAAPASLDAWLQPLHPSLRSAVRARVEGERAALPAPALTPYLVGLLVLLGMLGTLLGMVATLRGTSAALDGATGLDAIRAALYAPIRGLGFAFGTSIAGVASSAMLGLLSALCRRERLETVQKLDALVASTLRPFSHAHQREAGFALMQRQAEAMPALVERLEAMIAAIERQGATLGERQLAGQQAFIEQAEASHTRLAAMLGETLTRSAADSARAAGAAIVPVVEAAMAGLAQESGKLHGTLMQAVDRQLDGLTAGFETNTARVAGIWNEALAEHRRSGEALAGELRGALEGFNSSFENRSAALLREVEKRQALAAEGASRAWDSVLARHEASGEKLADDNRQALSAAAATFESHAGALLRELRAAQGELQAGLAERDETRLAAWTGALAAMSTTLREEWQSANAQAARHQQAICATLEQTAGKIAAQAGTQADRALGEITRAAETAASAWQAASTQAAERQQAICDALARMAEDVAAQTELRTNGTIAEIARAAEANATAWQLASTQAAERQQAICDALAKTANDVAAQTEAHASGTIAEIARAAEANATAWQLASTQAAERQQAICDALAKTANDVAAQTEAHASGTIAEIARAAEANATAWQLASTQAAERQQAICDALAKTANDVAAQTEAHASGTIAEIARAAEANATAWQLASTQAAERQQRICDALEKTAAEIATHGETQAKGTLEEIARAAAAHADAWQAACSQAAERQQSICDALAQTADTIAAQTEAHASGTIAEIARAAEANAAAWRDTARQAAERQQTICDALAQTADTIAAQTEAHANGTIAEIGRLVDAASQAPRAAADVVAELRQKLSESMVQDTAMLEERGRLLSTVATLLDAVSHASNEQRTAIDALVSTSAELLERVGTRFDQQVEVGAQVLEGASAQVGGSAVEMASLADAFGQAVQHFGDSSQKLMTQLARIEASLDKSLARSDEQLAYYVAQAKDVIDLSLMSQKQIVENLQRLDGAKPA
ncbi:DUF802 domain-containing protein [Burkholderia gladioli]|uniref:DUF802 domain-containing protein n=1 Tax=Burkholderia gladioli TaxID=28095 RepID=UPI0026554925|nr:DUF802 domain-containing protein [Burkholderia gladioli]MDN7720193.1 DUF802 domain-containing protein [Burkholderia gladioli]